MDSFDEDMGTTEFFQVQIMFRYADRLHGPIPVVATGTVGDAIQKMLVFLDLEDLTPTNYEMAKIDTRSPRILIWVSAEKKLEDVKILEMVRVQR